MAQGDPIAMMQRETRLEEGVVPTTWNGEPIAPGQFVLDDDALLFRAPNGPDFLYRRGAGATMQCASAAAQNEAELWFKGSVYSAIAAINGLIPIHASAVEQGGKVIAITGPTGAGKSTLAAALATSGLPLFCDDTLLVALQNSASTLCLPGHKQLKLDMTAASLAGAKTAGRVSPIIDKRYSDVPMSTLNRLAEMETLIVLSEEETTEVKEISAGQAIAALLQDHYTVEFGQLAAKGGQADYWKSITKLVANVQCVEFARPKAAATFGSSLSELRSYLKASGAS